MWTHSMQNTKSLKNFESHVSNFAGTFGSPLDKLECRTAAAAVPYCAADPLYPVFPRDGQIDSSGSD